MKKCAILQSNYIPWKGVFDMMNKIDIFVFFEDVQFTRRDWRTRNKIKTSQGSSWLTIPVKKSSRDNTLVYEVEISEFENWQEKHYKTIVSNYSKAPFFNDFKYLLNEIYLAKKWINLSEFNIFTSKLLANTLNINVEFINSKDLKTEGVKDDKLIKICQKIGANHYLSGPSAKNYIDNQKFDLAGIKLEYMNYNYPDYQQLHGEFDHYVSVLDVLFNCGPSSNQKIFT